MGTEGELYYWDYLGLDALLASQQPISGGEGEPAHDEMLFIIVHQCFELWFKQILVELDDAVGTMHADTVPEKEMGRVVDRLDRIIAIQRLLTGQLEVLETMTPLDFLDFREQLAPASGFQSVQFRLVENRLGLDPEQRLTIAGASYTDVMSDEHRRMIEETERAPNLRDAIDRWLARTPFLRFGDFDFWAAYREAVDAMLERERAKVSEHPNLDDASRDEQLQAVEESAAQFETLFDAEQYERLRERGHRQLSQDAFCAALLISLYRDEPLFQLPFRLLTAVTDIDEGFAAWRYRHALLAHRMIGGKVGTGGTAGHTYLEAAARKHRVFRDLFDLPTFFVPRSALPELPAEVREQLSFRYESAPA
ncbi:tryptophan 2,3-dioxygenase [Egibacter rhizosphaerae]|uniref:Tryptophan 2,3-dioxygenase n=1 Tax=Egibacter rhizosphaerae TaxID=1670831 RepID=A0A411YF86_9ACTN|nr:tryptophan 2,3-dioxygenase family protein [Egibacter rhizosphaerae]QBI19841.1 tryptophan 2,3-dioxygenase [Egibacter rhizosphaerae]